MTSLLSYDEATEAQLRQMYAHPEDWDWAAASARLTAYASQPVLDATRMVENAHIEVKAKVEDFTALRTRVDSPAPGRPDDAEVPAAWREIEAALAAAEAADDELHDLIRADLARKPSDRTALAGPAANPRHRS